MCVLQIDFNFKCAVMLAHFGDYSLCAALARYLHHVAFCFFHLTCLVIFFSFIYFLFILKCRARFTAKHLGMLFVVTKPDI